MKFGHAYARMSRRKMKRKASTSCREKHRSSSKTEQKSRDLKGGAKLAAAARANRRQGNHFRTGPTPTRHSLRELEHGPTRQRHNVSLSAPGLAVFLLISITRL
jgi:hypothetical protein